MQVGSDLIGKKGHDEGHPAWGRYAMRWSQLNRYPQRVSRAKTKPTPHGAGTSAITLIGKKGLDARHPAWGRYAMQVGPTQTGTRNG